MSDHHRPPRLARWLVGLRSLGDHRHEIEGDLDELYAVRRTTRGRVYAGWRYYRDVLSLWRRLDPRPAADSSLHVPHARLGTSVRSSARARASLASVWPDARYAARRLARRPAMTMAAVATLALAVGANIAIFGLIDRVVLHPLDVPDPSELVTAQRTFKSQGVEYRRASMDWEDVGYARELSALPNVAVSTSSMDRASKRLVVVVNGRDEPLVVDGTFVSENYFRVLGMKPALGRDFAPADNAGDGASVVIVSSAFWGTRLGGAKDVIGRTLHINGVPAVIIGVASPSFTGTDLGVAAPDIFLPLATGPRLATDIGAQTDGRGMHFAGGMNRERSSVSPLSDFSVVARLKSREQGHAQAEFVATFGAEWSLVPLVDTMLPFDARSDLRQFLLLLAGAVALTFLIGCANLASLLLARTEERRVELAVRAALGAGRWRLVQELGVEAALLAVAGSAAAVLVASWIDQGLSAFVLPGGIAVSSLRHGVDEGTILFASSCAIVAALLIGFAPVLRATSRHLALDVQRQGGSAPRLGGARVLAGVQAAVAVVLVFAGILFVRTLSNALATDLGFDPHGLAAATISAPRSPGSYAAIEELVARARDIPGIVAVTAGPLPLVRASEGTQNSVSVDGVPVALKVPIDVVYATAAYFSTLGQPLAGGRDFNDHDRADAEPVAIVNAAAARLLWSTTNPLGHHVKLFAQFSSSTMSADRAVVGVVRDVKLRSLGDAGVPVIYLSRQQNEAYLAGYMAGAGNSFLVFRDSGKVAGIAAALARAATEVGLSLQAVTPLDQRIGEILMPQRLGRALLLLLGAMALALTIVGIYGLTACVVARHTKEIGVRMALGAGEPAIVRAVVGKTYVPVLAGAGVGGVMAWASGRLADRFMYGIHGSDVVTVAGAAAVVIVSAALATWLPARRALRIDPIETLRD